MKILWSGAFPDTPSGYGRVTWELLRGLKKYFTKKEDIIIFGVHPESRNHYYRKKYVEENFITENAMDKEILDYGVKKLPIMIKKYKPDMIFLYNDPWVLYHYSRIIREDAKYTGKIYAYIDICYIYNIKEHMKSIINCVDIFLTFSKFAKKELQFFDCKKPIHVLNHGLNRKDFFKIDQQKARDTLQIKALDYYKKDVFNFKNNPFIIFNGNRNQPRKRIDITIKAYADFIENNNDPNTILILNNQNNTVYGWNYHEIIHNEFYHKRNIKNYEKYFLFLKKIGQSLPVELLNLLYNAVDIGINTCDGEGFGLVNLEHAFVGKPQIAGNFAGLGEFLKHDFSILVECNNTFYHDRLGDGVGGMGWTLDYKKISRAIEMYYKNPILRKEHGLRAHKYLKNKFKWEDIQEQLYNIIQ